MRDVVRHYCCFHFRQRWVVLIVSPTVGMIWSVQSKCLRGRQVIHSMRNFHAMLPICRCDIITTCIVHSAVCSNFSKTPQCWCFC